MSEAYELSRRIFEDNATKTGDNVMLRNIALHGYTANDVANVVAMQNALARWQVRNFGVSSDVALALGVYGEIDELANCDTNAETADAWADVAIFAGQLLINNRMSIAPILFNVRIDPAESLSHIVLKNAQGIRGVQDGYRERLFNSLHRIISHDMVIHGVSYDQHFRTYLRVGAEVLKRDWRKFPLNGRDQ